MWASDWDRFGSRCIPKCPQPAMSPPPMWGPQCHCIRLCDIRSAFLNSPKNVFLELLDARWMTCTGVHCCDKSPPCATHMILPLKAWTSSKDGSRSFDAICFAQLPWILYFRGSACLSYTSCTPASKLCNRTFALFSYHIVTSSIDHACIYPQNAF